jgi:hypothetical protein
MTNDLAKEFNSPPDAEKHPPATAVTPRQIAESEKAIREARTQDERAAAEAAHQVLCRSQHEQLLRIHQQREFKNLTHSNNS